MKRSIKKNFLRRILLLIIYSIIFTLIDLRIKKEEEVFLLLENEHFKIIGLVNMFVNIVILSLTLMIITYIIRKYFFLRHKYTEDNNFFLKTRLVFFLNYTLNALSYLILTLSFISFTKVLLTFIFISINHFVTSEKNEANSDIHPKLLTWKDRNLLNIFVLSLLLFIGLPLLTRISKNKPAFVENIINSISYEEEGLTMIYKTFNETVIGQVISLIKKVILNKKLIFWAILANYLRIMLKEKVSEFQNFWNEVNSIDERLGSLKFFSKTQSIVENNNTNKMFSITFCYKTFNSIPNFIRRHYIENLKSFDNSFLNNLKKVLSVAEMIDKTVKNEKEKKFLIYSIFNKCDSLQELNLLQKKFQKII